MALNAYKPQKLYYSIKEVAEMFGLNESTLRYWETEFPFLKPKTSGPAKVRQYQEHHVLYYEEKGFDLGVSVRPSFAHRLVEERDKDQERSHHDEIR